MSTIPEQLIALLGQESVLTGENIQPSYITDWSETPGVKPCAVVRPCSTEDIQKTLRFCSEHQIPVVPQGGHTGLAGGATVTSPQSIVISTERMNKIEHLDENAATIQVQAGVILESINQATQRHDLILGVDFGARGSCHIGGTIATNAGGNAVIQFGTMREQVLGLEAVLADGTVLPMLYPMLKNNTGYDLKQLFIGSEGTLGIITRAILRLRPAPKVKATAIFALPDYSSALRIFAMLQSRFPGCLSAFELMWQSFWDWSMAHMEVSNPFDDTYALYALVEVDGQNSDIIQTQLEELMESALEKELLLDATIAQSKAQAMSLWKIREAPTEFYAYMKPPINFDVSIPLSRIDDFVQSCNQAIAQRWPGHLTVCFGHVGDGNLHISTDGQTVDGDEKGVEEIVYRIVSDYAGSSSAEHGIGLHKKPYLGTTRSIQEIQAMKSIKQALDPLNIMNPGKIF